MTHAHVPQARTRCMLIPTGTASAWIARQVSSSARECDKRPADSSAAAARCQKSMCKLQRSFCFAMSLPNRQVYGNTSRVWLLRLSAR